jgi:hypothetical protein
MSAIIFGPKDMFGTKDPSMTSRWTHWAPLEPIKETASPTREKSAASIEGATMQRGTVFIYLFYQIIMFLQSVNMMGGTGYLTCKKPSTCLRLLEKLSLQMNFRYVIINESSDFLITI